jgi:lysophospholipase L1-like esterase
LLPVEFLNPSASGATVCDPGYELTWAVPQLERALAAGADVVLIALGTNDLAVLFRSPEEVVDCHRAIARLLPRGVVFLVALPPPGYADHAWFSPAARDLANRLRAAFAPNVIDFASGFSNDLLDDDGLHMNHAGQALRASRAIEALARAALGGRPHAWRAPARASDRRAERAP